MFAKKKSKVKRMRGTNSHGWGHKKKHRGKGNRGGSGLAGTGARGDSKKPTILKKFGSSYFGKKGFKSINKKHSKTLSLRDVELKFDKLIEEGLITKEKDSYVLDLTKTKYDKILGRTKLSKKLVVKCREISNFAKSSIENSGGKVEIL